MAHGGMVVVSDVFFGDDRKATLPPDPHSLIVGIKP